MFQDLKGRKRKQSKRKGEKRKVITTIIVASNLLIAHFDDNNEIELVACSNKIIEFNIFSDNGG